MMKSVICLLTVLISILTTSPAEAASPQECERRLRTTAKKDETCRTVLTACQNAQAGLSGLDEFERKKFLQKLGQEYGDVIPSAGVRKVDWCQVLEHYQALHPGASGTTQTGMQPVENQWGHRKNSPIGRVEAHCTLADIKAYAAKGSGGLDGANAYRYEWRTSQDGQGGFIVYPIGIVKAELAQKAGLAPGYTISFKDAADLAWTVNAAKGTITPADGVREAVTKNVLPERCLCGK